VSNHWDKPSRRDRRAKTKREPKPLRTHVFTGSGQADYAGVPICQCGALRTERVHDLPDTVDATVIDARRLGEGADHEN
jgi:hypothetical protein